MRSLAHRQPVLKLCWDPYACVVNHPFYSFSRMFAPDQRSENIWNQNAKMRYIKHHQISESNNKGLRNILTQENSASTLWIFRCILCMPVRRRTLIAIKEGCVALLFLSVRKKPGSFSALRAHQKYLWFRERVLQHLWSRISSRPINSRYTRRLYTLLRGPHGHSPTPSVTVHGSYPVMDLHRVSWVRRVPPLDVQTSILVALG